MICFFIAGAMGSYAGSVLWQRFAWAGVCGLGCLLLVAGCIVYASTGQKNRAPNANGETGLLPEWPTGPEI
jgi:hypothetical protein